MAPFASEPSQELLDYADPVAPQEDKLTVIRAKVARVRDLRLKVADLQEQVKNANKEINDLTFKDLPDLFTVAQIRTIGLDAKGNLPAYDASLTPFYKASISMEWEEPRRDRAFDLLQKLDAGELIHTVVTVELRRGELAKLDILLQALDNVSMPYDVKMHVHWSTLKKWVKDRYEGTPKRELTPNQLETIGATVATVVEVKPRKE